MPVPISAPAVRAWRDDDGLFRVSGTRAGRTARFVVDTGANRTVLSQADAALFGLEEADGPVETLRTAAGPTSVRRATLSGLVVAGRSLPPLQVVVVDGGLAHSLLGQDALAALGRLTMERDRLEITAPAG